MEKETNNQTEVLVEKKTCIDWNKELIKTTNAALTGLLVGRVNMNMAFQQSEIAGAAIEIAKKTISKLKKEIEQ